MKDEVKLILSGLAKTNKCCVTVNNMRKLPEILSKI